MIFRNYDTLVDTVRRHGREVPSRYGPTREISGITVVVPAGALVSRERLSEGIGWQELLQLLAGEFDPGAIARVAPRARLELFTEDMAYGPRLRRQVPAVLEALRADPDTRQGVLFAGSAEDGPTPRQPCTGTIQLLLREGNLSAFVSMRSWDLVKGLPYDLTMFGGLVLAAARNLAVRPGGVAVTAASAHVYDEDTHEVRRSRRAFRLGDEVPTDWEGLRSWAGEEYRRLGRGEVPRGIEFVDALTQV